MIIIHGKKRKILTEFDDTIANVVSNNELQPTVTELYIWRGKLCNTIAFIIQSYFLVRKNVRFNSTHYSIMKITKR